MYVTYHFINSSKYPMHWKFVLISFYPCHTESSPYSIFGTRICCISRIQILFIPSKCFLYPLVGIKVDTLIRKKFPMNKWMRTVTKEIFWIVCLLLLLCSFVFLWLLLMLLNAYSDWHTNWMNYCCRRYDNDNVEENKFEFEFSFFFLDKFKWSCKWRRLIGVERAIEYLS